MPIRDLSAIFNADIEYPGVPSKKHPEGKTYRVPSPDAATGARLTARMTLALKEARGGTLTDDEQASLLLDDDGERGFYADILGPVYDEMMTDDVPWTVLRSIAQDAHLLITDNQALADITLAAEGEASARANRATRRAAAKKAPAKATKRTPPRKAGSKSSPASSATKARSSGRASTRSSTTPAAKKAPVRKAG